MSPNKLAYDRGSDLYGVAFALDAIGNLLGADASEHYINAQDADGLAHAVVALGVLVKLIGGDLCEARDPAAHQDLAPRFSESENVARIPLAVFAKGRQHVAARQLGVRQAAISKAIRVNREIFVTQHSDGTVTATEERPFPSTTSGGGQ